jgi:hypothetical protein
MNPGVNPMADTAVSVFDPAKLADAMRDKVRLELLNVITPEQWDAMIRKQIDEFTEPVVKNTSHSGKVYSDSPFKLLINEMIKEKLKSQLKEYLDGPEFQSQVWRNGSMDATEAVKRIALEAAPAILSQMIQGVVQAAVQHALSAAGR